MWGEKVRAGEVDSILTDFAVHRPWWRHRACARLSARRHPYRTGAAYLDEMRIRSYRRGVQPPRRLELHGAHPSVSQRDGSIRLVPFTVDWFSRSGEILLHFNARPDEGVVVVTSYVGGLWGDEKVVRGYPFDPDHLLVLGFDVLRDGFRIDANGRDLCE